MEKMIPTKMEIHRDTKSPFVSKKGDSFGCFTVQAEDGTLNIMIMSNDPEWEHAVVTRIDKIPSWEEMCLVKKLYWGEDVTVIQFHPRKKDYWNIHPYSLHMWKHKDGHKLPDLQKVYSGDTTSHTK